MTAAAVARRSSARRGLMPVRSLRDMAPLADLMEAAFGGDVDPEGQRLIREMRSYGRAGILGWLAGKFVLPPAAYPMGYVWYEDGRLVGNASVLPVESGAGRWVLANVAVKAEYRRRGIAREMVRSCMELARRRHGAEMVLQVESQNEGALQLYRDLGFRHLGDRTTYRRPSNTSVPEKPDFGLARERHPEEWREQYRLALEGYPEGVVWPFPVRAEFFRGPAIGGLVVPGPFRHWVWPEGPMIVGSLTARPDWDRSVWRLVLLSARSHRGQVEAGLISSALDYLGSEAAVVLDYTAATAEPTLASLGFHAERSLTWMGAPVSKEETEPA